jgi:hypothetical protein
MLSWTQRWPLAEMILWMVFLFLAQACVLPGIIDQAEAALG